MSKKCCGTCKHWDRDYVLKKPNGKPADFSPSPCRYPLVMLPAMPMWQERQLNIHSAVDSFMCASYGKGCKVWEKA